MGGGARTRGWNEPPDVDVAEADDEARLDPLVSAASLFAVDSRTAA